MPATTETTHIEHDLDATRARLGSHLSQLQDRLSPGQVLDDLMGYFRGSEGAAFGANLLDQVRANPMPAAITTVGLAWLMSSNTRPGAQPATAPVATSQIRRLPIYGHDDHTATLARLDTIGKSTLRASNEPEHDYAARLDAAHGQAIGLARHGEESAQSFGERVRHAVAALQDAATSRAHDLTDQATGMAGAATDAFGRATTATQGAISNAAASAGSALSAGGRSANQATGNLMAAITESPVLLGALGLAAGALLGALLPHSEHEDAALGGIANQARDALTNLATQGREAGTRVAAAVTDAAHTSLQQGFDSNATPGQLIDAALSGDLATKAKQAATGLLDATEQAVKKEGLSA